MKCVFHNKLAECRAAIGINKSRLALRLRRSRAYVTRLENGEISPSFEMAMRIARYFKKPVEEIFQLVEGGQPAISSPCPAADRNHK